MSYPIPITASKIKETLEADLIKHLYIHITLYLLQQIDSLIFSIQTQLDSLCFIKASFLDYFINFFISFSFQLRGAAGSSWL